LFKQEMPYIFSPEDDSGRTFNANISSSYTKSSNVVYFFLGNNKGKFILIGILCLLVYFSFSAVSKKVVASKKLYELHNQNEIVKYPLLSAIFVVFTVSEFLFTYPPFAFQAMMWLVLSVILMLFHTKDPGIFSGKIWLILYILFMLTIAENFVLEPAPFERWILFFLSLLSCIMIVVFWKKKKEEILKNKLFKPIILLFLFLETVSFLAIIFGRYNLSKTFLTSGYFALISGIILFWTYQLLLRALNTYIVASSEVGGNKNLFIKLKPLHDKTPGWFGGLFIFGWLIALVRNFYFYNVIISTVNDLLFEEHTIGKYSFTMESMLTFLLVIFLSGLISNIVSFLADNSTVNSPVPGKKKGGLSNWLLLIRLSIIVAGVLLAFAAAGIPMDRLTIIIGSLGVGIGFGLQSIVNNLISGVILAFERPVEIGDQIELAGKTGRIKAIGIRSSRMIDFDGAEVIIPNGDLLSQHVINWTLSNDQRRVEIIVGVKYGTDLYTAKDILEKILLNNNKIKHQPLPAVLLNKFNNSSIDFRLLFWTDIAMWIDVKSEIILSIDTSFKEAGIEIPYAQQDIYIKELPDRNKDKDKEV
jgi:potassium efflux system protein